MSSPLRSEIEPAPRPVAALLARAVAVPARLARALFLPDRAVPAEVREGRYGAALVAVVLAALVSAAAVGARIDTTHDVLAKNPVPATNAVRGPVGKPVPDEVKSDRQIDEEIERQTAVERVGLGMGAGLGKPVAILALAVALYLLGRYVGGKPTMRGSIAAAAHGALPGAVKALVVAVAAWRTPSIRPDEVSQLAAGGFHVATEQAGLVRALDGVGVFTVWSFLLLGFGFAAAAGISRRRSFLALGVGTVLYLLASSIAAGGPPPPPTGAP